MGGEQEPERKEELLLQQVRSTDFVEYGFEAEFIGRLPVVTHCRRLSVDDLFQILKRSEGSLLKQYKRDFLAYGIDAYFKDGAMRALAELAAREETGARGLMTVCERIFRDYKYHLPDHEVTELVVDRKLVEDPKASLDELLARPDLHHDTILQFQLKRFETEFHQRYGVEITFTPEAVALISERGERPERRHPAILPGSVSGIRARNEAAGSRTGFQTLVRGPSGHRGPGGFAGAVDPRDLQVRTPPRLNWSGGG